MSRVPARRSQDIDARSHKFAKSSRQSPERRNLGRPEILAAALKIVDESGLDALTMRALADQLGVYPNALYWHVGSRNALVGTVATMIFDELELPDQRDVTWPDWIRSVVRECRLAMHRHPNLARVIGAEMVPTTAGIPFVERVLGVLSRAGFTGDDLVAAYNCVIGFAFGWATLELSSEPPVEDGSWKDDFSKTLADLSPMTFPILTNAMPSMRNAAFMTRWDSGRVNPLERSHEFALDVLIAGLEARLAPAT